MQKKAEFVKAAGGNYKQGISKAAKAWKELAAVEKKPFEDEAAKRKVQYEKELKAFLDAGGEKKKRRSKDDDATPAKKRKKIEIFPRSRLEGPMAATLQSTGKHLCNSAKGSLPQQCPRWQVRNGRHSALQKRSHLKMSML